MKKKTIYVWIVLIFVALGVVFGFIQNILSLINIKVLITPSFANSVTFNIIDLVLSIIGTVLLFIYFIKLYNLPQNIIKWTNIVFGYSIFELFFSLIVGLFTMPLIFIILRSILIIIVAIIIGIIWFTFVRHLKNNTEKLFGHSQAREITETPNEKSILNKNTTIKIVIIIIIATSIILLVYIFVKSKIKEEITSNVPIETNTLINTKGVASDNGKIVEKLIKGTFKTVNSNETFEYTEKYNPTIWNVNTRNYNWNTVNECVNLGCNFVYFGNYDKNLLMFTSIDINQDKKQGKLALFNDRDNPLIGKITKVVFYVDGNEISGLPSSEDRHVDVFYTISYKENGISKTTNRIEQNICNYENKDAICAPVIKKVGAEVFFFDGPEDIYLRSIFLFDKIIKTKLINYSTIN